MKLDFMEPIKLEEMDKVKLMNRTDTKYSFHTELLPKVLDAIKEDYYLLNINGKSELLYSTTYYDTFNDSMFISHHNGKLNRYKVRRRSYVASEISFLEIKFKSNKGRTIKNRVSTDFGNKEFTGKEHDFLKENSPFDSSNLKISLENTFTRITLVNKNFKERCTIDLNLHFETNYEYKDIKNLAIVEIKSDGKSVSTLSLILRDLRIKSNGFSKYIMGRSITDKSLKRNSYKRKIRVLSKTTKSDSISY